MTFHTKTSRERGKWPSDLVSVTRVPPSVLSTGRPTPGPVPNTPDALLPVPSCSLPSDWVLITHKSLPVLEEKLPTLTQSTFFPSDAASRRLRSTFKKIELYLIRNFWLKCPLGTIDNYRVLSYLKNAVKQRISKNEDSLWQWWWNKPTINRKQPFLLFPFRVSLGGLKSMKSHCWWRIKETFGWEEDGWDEDSWSYTEAPNGCRHPLQWLNDRRYSQAPKETHSLTSLVIREWRLMQLRKSCYSGNLSVSSNVYSSN